MIDMHVHYFPERVFQAIWSYFAEKGHGLWKVRYKLHGAAIIDQLKAFGVTRMPTLVYAHKPGMAKRLNDFVHDEAAQHPELIPFGTIYVGDGDCETEARRIFEKLNFAGIKLHPYVSQEQLDDARFFPAYELMQEL